MKPFVTFAAALVAAALFLFSAPAQAAKIPAASTSTPAGDLVSTSGATYDPNSGDATFTAAGQSIVIDTGSAGGVSLQVAGTWAGALSVQWSDKAASGFTSGALFTPDDAGGAPEVTTITGNQQYAGNSYGRFMKLTSSGGWTGSATVSPWLHLARFPARAVAVSGRALIASATPTVTAGSSYASGQVVGGLQTFSSVVTADNPTGLIQSIGLHFKSAQTADLDFVFCAQNPTSSAITDKTAVSLAVADFSKCRAFHLSGASCVSLGAPTYCEIPNLASPFILPTGTDAYGFLVTRGTPTFASTSDVSISVRIVR